MSRYEYDWRRRETAAYKKFKFFKHLKFYFIFVGFMLFMNVFMDAHIHFYSVAFWWGLGIVFHYLKTFGWAHVTMDQDRYEEQRTFRYESQPEPEEEEFVELKQPQKAWRDRDLV